MNASVPVKTPIFSRSGDLWVPDAYAAGPFRGLYGGAVAGLVGAAIEEHARNEGWGVPLSSSVTILRPAPLSPLATEISVLQAGRRNAVAECVLRDPATDKIIAKGQAIFVQPAPNTSAPLVPEPQGAQWNVDPETLLQWQNGRRPEHVNFLHILDMRDETDANGQPTIRWSRMMRPLMPFPSRLGALFAAADNASAFWLSASGAWPTDFGFPNVDVSVHVSRAPQGEWIGLLPDALLHQTGMGMSEGVLYDQAGVLGRTCQTNLIVPRG